MSSTSPRPHPAPTAAPSTTGPASSTSTCSPGATYASQALEHWSRWRPRELQEMPDPAAFFADLGYQASQQIEQLADSLAGQDPPGEGYLAKLGRLRMAQFTAQSQVTRELLLPEPEPETEPETEGLDERKRGSADPESTSNDQKWLPTVLHPDHPRYHELDEDPGLTRRNHRFQP